MIDSWIELFCFVSLGNLVFSGDLVGFNRLVPLITMATKSPSSTDDISNPKRKQKKMTVAEIMVPTLGCSSFIQIGYMPRHTFIFKIAHYLYAIFRNNFVNRNISSVQKKAFQVVAFLKPCKPHSTSRILYLRPYSNADHLRHFHLRPYFLHFLY